MTRHRYLKHCLLTGTLLAAGLAGCSKEQPQVSIHQQINVTENTVHYTCSPEKDLAEMPDWIEACNRMAVTLLENLEDKGFTASHIPQYPFTFATTEDFLEVMGQSRDEPWQSLEITSAFISVKPLRTGESL